MTAEPGTRVLQADSAAIEAAAACLSAGGLVAFPTETVYGLGADACNGEAVARLYAAKSRPVFNPLIVHVADVAAARRLGAFNADAERLATAFWPGPLTLVLPRQPMPGGHLALAGLDSVAVRVPAHPLAQALLEAFGGPIVAPRPTVRAMSRRPAPRMCWPTCAGASTCCSTAGPARSASSRPSSPASTGRPCYARAAWRAKRSSGAPPRLG